MIEHLATLARPLANALFAGLWEAPLFAVAAWFVLRARPRANATTRHSVFACALLASLVLPVATAALVEVHGGVTARVAPDAFPAHVRPYVAPKREAPVPTRRIEPAPRPAFALPALSRARFEVPALVAVGSVALWFAGAAFFLIRLIASLLHIERLKRDALPLSIAYRAGLTRWAAAGAIARKARLCVSDEIDVPIAVGLFDAMILLPTPFLDELESHEIDSIVLHELAHLRRRDDWINAIERVTCALLFFNPAVAWIAARLDLEREIACDDWVLQQNDALPYANCLAKVVAAAVWPHRAVAAPGAFVTQARDVGPHRTPPGEAARRSRAHVVRTGRRRRHRDRGTRHPRRGRVAFDRVRIRIARAVRRSGFAGRRIARARRRLPSHGWLPTHRAPTTSTNSPRRAIQTFRSTISSS